MDPDKLLDEAEVNLREAAGMIRAQGNPAVITALASYAGACATLATAQHMLGSTPSSVQQIIQETLDGSLIQE